MEIDDASITERAWSIDCLLQRCYNGVAGHKELVVEHDLLFGTPHFAYQPSCRETHRCSARNRVRLRTLRDVVSLNTMISSSQIGSRVLGSTDVRRFSSPTSTETYGFAAPPLCREIERCSNPCLLSTSARDGPYDQYQNFVLRLVKTH